MIDVRSVSSQLLVEAAHRQGLSVHILSKRHNLFEVSNDKHSFFIQATSVPINSQTGSRISQNKFLTKKVLKQHNLPVPKSWLATSIADVQKIVAKHQPYPLVIKPVSGSHGNSVFSSIEHKKELDFVLKELYSRKVSENILIEEYATGRDLRVSVVGNSVPAVMERIPAHVIGDGEKNIKQLVRVFNQHPLVGEKYEKPMCKIHLTKEAKRILAKQGLTTNSIPKDKQRVWLRHNANISTGGIGKDVTDAIPDDVKQIAIAACAAVGLKVAGVDIIYNDTTKRAVILEINDVAGIDIHHYPAVGKSRDVAGAIIKYLFKPTQLPKTKINSNGILLPKSQGNEYTIPYVTHLPA